MACLKMNDFTARKDNIFAVTILGSANLLPDSQRQPIKCRVVMGNFITAGLQLNGDGIAMSCWRTLHSYAFRMNAINDGLFLRGIHWWSVGPLTKYPLMRNFDIYLSLHFPNKLNTQSSCQWFETSWCLCSVLALHWRHNDHDGVSNHQPHGCLLNPLFRSKKTSKLRVTGLCAGNSPGPVNSPAQRASNAENVSIWWRHHGNEFVYRLRWCEPAASKETDWFGTFLSLSATVKWCLCILAAITGTTLLMPYL